MNLDKIRPYLSLSIDKEDIVYYIDEDEKIYTYVHNRQYSHYQEVIDKEKIALIKALYKINNTNKQEES